jgi:hypothetical protein
MGGGVVRVLLLYSHKRKKYTVVDSTHVMHVEQKQARNTEQIEIIDGNLYKT